VPPKAEVALARLSVAEVPAAICQPQPDTIQLLPKIRIVNIVRLDLIGVR
jgi:hypothetical protein